MNTRQPLSWTLFSLLLLALSVSGASNCGNGGGNPPLPPDTTSLSVSVTGIGAGTVNSNVGDIDCSKSGGACDSTLEVGTDVALTATPDQGYFFNGWLGETCQGTGPCSFSLDAPTTLQASFVNIVYWSQRNLDPTQDSANDNQVFNIWTTNSDGSNAQAIAALDVALIDSERPIFSPDGNQIAFNSERNIDGSPTANDSDNLWVVNADGSDLHPLAGLNVSGTDNSFTPPRWSPDGSKILFASRRNIDGGPTPSVNSTFNIWVVGVDNNNLQVLSGIDAVDVFSDFGQWAPDGSQILFSSSRNLDLTPTVNPGSGDNIWLMNADGSNPTPLTQLTVVGASANNPQWSPDGSRIVFNSNRSLSNDQNLAPENARNIWIANADGTSPTPLTELTANADASFPQWSPNGTLITFNSNKNLSDPAPDAPANPTFNIWVIEADGSEDAVPLTDRTVAGSDFPYWAPDSSVVIFDSSQSLTDTDPMAAPNGSANIWIVKPDGSGLLPVTELTANQAFSFTSVDLD